MKRVAVITAIVFLVLALLAVAWQLRTVVLVFMISLVIGATLDGPIEGLTARGTPRRVSVLIVYAFSVGVLALLLVVIALPIVSETNLLIIDLTDLYNQWRFYLSSLTGQHVDLLSGLMPTDEQFTEGVEGGVTSPVLRQMVGMTQDVGIMLGQFLLAFVLSIYWTLDRTRFERVWLSLLAPEQRGQLRVVMRRLTTTVGDYIRSELLQMVLAGGLLTLGFWIIGLKYPFTAALLAALAWLIPLVGGLIALLSVLLIAWLSGLTAAMLAGIFTVCVLLIMEVQVESRFFAGKRYWGVLVVFVMLALGSEFGLVGLLIAPPMAVALQIVLDALLEAPARPPAASHLRAGAQKEVQNLPALRARLQEIEAQMAADESLRTPRLENIVARLGKTIAASEAAYSDGGGAVNTTQ